MAKKRYGITIRRTETKVWEKYVEFEADIDIDPDKDKDYMLLERYLQNAFEELSDAAQDVQDHPSEGYWTRTDCKPEDFSFEDHEIDGMACDDDIEITDVEEV